MALKAGRVGVAPSEVDEFGQIIGEITPTNVYTKTQADAKFATKEALLDGITDVYGVMGENGAHNRIYVPDQTVTQSTITITVTNGVLEFSGANATSSAIWVEVPNVKVSKGSYVFKGLDLGQSSVSIIQLQKSDSTVVGQINLSESKATLNITENVSNYKLYVRIAPNTDATGVKAYPELVVPNDVAPFTPYAMTNRELTEKVNEIPLPTELLTASQLKACVTDAADFSAFKTNVLAL